MRLVITWTLAAILAVPSVGQKSPAKQPFTLLLTAEPKASLNSGVWVKVRWTNASDQDLDSSANILDATNVDSNFIFDLLDKNGSPVPARVYKFPQTSGHAEFGALKPGESITHEVNLARLFELNQAGKYTVQVSRLAPKSMGGSKIKSNIVSITVIE